MTSRTCHGSRNKNKGNFYVWNINFTRAKSSHKHHGDTPTSTPLSEVWQEEREALSPVELVYFSSSSTGHPGAAALAFVGHSSLLLSSKAVLSSGRSLFGSLRDEICRWQTTVMVLFHRCGSRNTAQQRPSALVFPQRVNVGAEERRAAGLSSLSKHLFSAITCKVLRSGLPAPFS